MAAGIGAQIMAGRKDELKAKANGAAPQIGSGSIRASSVVVDGNVAPRLNSRRRHL
jgi:hypothetical protein